MHQSCQDDNSLIYKIKKFKENLFKI